MEHRILEVHDSIMFGGEYMNKVVEVLKNVKRPETNKPLAIAAVVLAAVLTGFGLLVDAGTLLSILLVVVPLVGGVAQWNTSSLTEEAEEAEEALEAESEESKSDA